MAAFGAMLRGAFFVAALLAVSSAQTPDVTYQYDHLGRLVETRYEANSKHLIYCYDAAGNRKIVQTGDAATPAPTDSSCYTASSLPPLTPPEPPTPFDGLIVVVPLNGFTAIAVPVWQ